MISEQTARRYYHSAIAEEHEAGLLGENCIHSKPFFLEFRGQQVLYLIATQYGREGPWVRVPDGRGGKKWEWQREINGIYAVIAGYVKGEPKKKVADANVPVTEVIPITDGSQRKELTDIITNKENIAKVTFWD